MRLPAVWMSGGAAEVYAVDTEGHYLGSLALTLTVNLDWEDMSAFVEDGQPRLLIADIGDNDAFRPFVTLHIVDEPEVSGETCPFESSSLPSRTFNVVYPDGPRDAESVAVDAQEGYVYILSKRDAIPQLYRVPLVPALPLVIAEALGGINIDRAPENAENPGLINSPTSMDFDASGTRLAIVTLTRAHVYTRGTDENWQQALQRAPQVFDLPDYAQIEAVAWSADGDAIWITSEGAPAPMSRIPLSP